MSNYIKNNFKNEIAVLNVSTVNYRLSKISKSKQNDLKEWYLSNYFRIKDKFHKRFSFDIIIKVFYE